MNNSTEKKHKYCIMPFRHYDIANIEQWLSQHAKSGWHLSKDQNILALDVFSFEKGESKNVTYRLVPCKNKSKTPILAEKSPADGNMQTDADCFKDWETVTNIWSFCVYRTCDTVENERNVSLDDHISLLKANKRRCLFEMFGLILILLLLSVLYPLCIASIHIRTCNVILALMLVVYKVFDCAFSIYHLNKHKSLPKASVSINAGSKATKTLWKLAKTVLIILLLLSLIVTAAGAAIKDADHEIHSDNLPFLTLQGYLNNNYPVLPSSIESIDAHNSSVKEWSDLLAPKCIEYAENAKVTLNDNDELTCGLYINYYEARNSLIAKEIAQEYYLFESRKKNFKLLETLNPEAYDVDNVWAYEGDLHFPVVILQKGRIIIKAYYYQISDDHQIDFEDLLLSLSRSIAKN